MMDKVITLFEIVPIGDGVSCMCKDENGEYYKVHKAYAGKDQLVFNCKVTAQEYINKYLNSELYATEAFGYNVKYLPCEIIYEI